MEIISKQPVEVVANKVLPKLQMFQGRKDWFTKISTV
jgi:hypothetical protein